MASGSPRCSSAYEIVSVEQGMTRLYAEMIQVISVRQRLWVRPLCLCEFKGVACEKEHWQLKSVHDLRGGSDLVWSAEVFQSVMDVEWIEILMHLPSDAPSLGMLASQAPQQAQVAKHKLRQFLKAVELT